jgi:hypothetical protein
MGLATIAQAMEAHEVAALSEAWGCEIGPWRSGAREMAVMDGWWVVGDGEVFWRVAEGGGK